MLLNGINHLAVISKDIDKLRDIYTEVFEAEVGPTKQHGDKGHETMTMIRIGPHTELNVVTIEGNSEPDRQTPSGGAVGWITSAYRLRPRRVSRPFVSG